MMFHNLSRYNTQLFTRELGVKFKTKDIVVIAESKKKYISFKVKINVKLEGVNSKDGKELYKNIWLIYITSCRFMASGLDKLNF